MDVMNITSILDTTVSDLFQTAGCLQGAGGYVLSPLSILYAGALLYFGANGPTKTNLDSALHFRTAFGNKSDLTSKKALFANTLKLRDGNAWVDDLIPYPPKNNNLNIKRGQATEVALVNGVFFDKSLKVKPDFMDAVTKSLHGAVGSEDFKNPTKAIGNINEWVKQNTLGRIPECVSKDSVSGKTNMVLANTLYFKAGWNMGFPEIKPSDKKEPFYALSGKTSQTQYMFARRAVPYAEDDELNVQYIEIPYADDFVFGIILPRERDGIRALERAWNKDSMRRLREKVPMLLAANQRLVNMKIPKFKLEGSFDLAQLLAKAGVTYAVQPNADFSNMVSSGKPVLSSSNHRVIFEINEYGTEAAAQSSVIGLFSVKLPSMMPMAESWVPDYAPANFTADHPFLFVVKHRPSEAILFIGRLESV